MASRHGWLSQTPASFRRAVLDRCALQKVAAGATIYATGDPPGGMYGLISGAFRVSVAQGERGPYFAHFFGPGDWFGEGPAISGRARIVGLCAARDSELLHLSLRSVDEILREQPASWRLFAALTLGKLEVAMWAIDDLDDAGQSQAVRRCALAPRRMSRRDAPGRRPAESPSM